jgi:protein ImuA
MEAGFGVRLSCLASDRGQVAYPGSDPSLRYGDLSPYTRHTMRAARVAVLRQGMARLERASHGPPAHLSLGIDTLHAHLPGPGLPCGVLNEISAATYGDGPAACGFLFALMAAASNMRSGPAVFVVHRRCLADLGAPYGHGLMQLGLDPGRLLLVEVRSDKDALWTMEEALRSSAHPAMVGGWIEDGLDLTLLRARPAGGTTAAATRWRITSAPAACDPFGAFAHPRWKAALERCRNGRTGEWLIEWDHVAHRFRLVESMADRAPAAGRAGVRHAG